MIFLSKFLLFGDYIIPKKGRSLFFICKRWLKPLEI